MARRQARHRHGRADRRIGRRRRAGRRRAGGPRPVPAAGARRGARHRRDPAAGGSAERDARARWPGRCATPPTTAPRSSACRSAPTARSGPSARRSPTRSARAWCWSRPWATTGRATYTKEKGTSYWSLPRRISRGHRGGRRGRAEQRRAVQQRQSVGAGRRAGRRGCPCVKRGRRLRGVGGTSSAAALVAGVAALIKARYPDLRPEPRWRRRWPSSSRGRPAAGYDDKIGFGVVDAVAALERRRATGRREASLPVPDEQHFGQGEDSPPPSAPGPDPVAAVAVRRRRRADRRCDPVLRGDHVDAQSAQRVKDPLCVARHGIRAARGS